MEDCTHYNGVASPRPQDVAVETRQGLIACGAARSASSSFSLQDVLSVSGAGTGSAAREIAGSKRAGDAELLPRLIAC